MQNSWIFINRASGCRGSPCTESRPLARPDNSCQRAGGVCLPAEEWRSSGSWSLWAASLGTCHPNQQKYEVRPVLVRKCKFLQFTFVPLRALLILLSCLNRRRRFQPQYGMSSPRETQWQMSTGTIDVLRFLLNAFSISVQPTYITKLKREHDIDWWTEKRVAWKIIPAIRRKMTFLNVKLYCWQKFFFFFS